MLVDVNQRQRLNAKKCVNVLYHVFVKSFILFTDSFAFDSEHILVMYIINRYICIRSTGNI
jgi:hypothetical protein